MTSERFQRRIEQLLDEADQAIAESQWDRVRDRAQNVLALDPGNADARALIDAADRAGRAADLETSPIRSESNISTPVPEPTSFADGRYAVKRFLGEGGKKRVYLAHDTQLDRDVAFALIKTEGLDEASRTRVSREAQAMGRLGSHPHIVTVYDIGEENDQPYLVLPVLPGGDVEGVIEKAEEHRLTIEQAVKIASETCLGLEFSHSKGIIHRDLKPGNVWLAEDGRAMIGDFGLAVAVDRSRLTQAGMMVGTVNYMPPEQAMGGEVSPRSDLYSLGAMLYEMVCGRPPFVGDESVAIIGQHLNTPPVAPTWHRPDCPPGLEALILRLLEKDAGKRPNSATEVREALASIGTTPAQPSVHEEVTAPHQHDPLYRRVFVGREVELRQLQQAYDAAVSGQGGLVMVVGEPGIGKTALCEQLSTYVSIRGGRTLVGHCYEEGSLSLPYLAFVEAMRTYVLARDPDGLSSDLGSGAAEVARIVSEVRDRVHVELRDASDPEDDRWRLLNAVSTFLRNATSVQPLVIVLEDLHWADRGTLDLLQHVGRNLQGARLLVVGTYRDVEVDRTHPLSGTLAELRRIGNFLRIPLRGLTVDEVHRMYEALRGNDVPWGQAELVHRQTEGNPLFVQEVLRYLVEEGIVVREGGRYVARTPGEGVPEGLRDVVGRRLSRLSEGTNHVLSIAAVIGRDFTLEVLQRVAGLPEEDVLSALEEATARSIIEQRPATGSFGFRFSHAFFRQTLYEEIFAPRRIRWHQQVGHALEEVFARRLEEHAAELAEHFAQSTETVDLEKAVRYGELAAQRATSVFAYGEAIRHLEQALRALEVLDPDDKLKRCDLLLQLGEALIAWDEPDRTESEAAEQAYALAADLGDEARAARAAGLGADAAYWRWGAGVLRSARYEEWLARLRQRAGVDPVARVRSLALVPFRDRRNDDDLSNAVAEARSLGEPDTFHLCVSLACLRGRSTDWTTIRQAIYELDSAENMRAGARYRSHSHYAAATRALAEGDGDLARQMFTEILSIAEKTPHSVVLGHSLGARIVQLSMEGRLEEAIEVGRREATAASFTELRRLLFWPVVLLGRLNEYLSFIPADTPEISIVEALRALVAGESEEAKRIFDQALASDSADPGAVWLFIAFQISDKRRVELMAERIVKDPASGSSGGVPTVTDNHLGAAFVLLGDFPEARRRYEAALDLATRLHWRPELALAHSGLAEVLLDHYPDEHDAAIEHLDFAIAEFREMKMQPAMERALGRRGLLKA